jgi:hypothetical protein
MLMTPDDVSQTTPHTVPDDRPADAFRRHESGAKWASIVELKQAQHHEPSALRPAFRPHARELRRAREPALAGKCERRLRGFIAHAQL